VIFQCAGVIRSHGPHWSPLTDHQRLSLKRYAIHRSIDAERLTELPGPMVRSISFGLLPLAQSHERFLRSRLDSADESALGKPSARVTALKHQCTP